MISIDLYFKKKIYSFFSFFFIFTIFFHKIEIFNTYTFIKISEIIFVILFIFYVSLDNYKIKKNLSKIDLIFFLWPLLNIFQFLYNSSNLLGALSSTYVFFIYLIFKNLLIDLGKDKIINYLIITLLFSSMLSIGGWSLSQLNVDINLTEYKVGWPIYLIKSYRSIAFMPTPNMLFFYLSFGFLIILNFNFKNKKSILGIIFAGIFFTFSKSLLIFIPLILFPYILKYKKFYLTKLYLLFMLLLIILFNFLTNIIFVPKNINFFEGYKHEHYMDKKSLPLYENSKFILYKSNYANLKDKSAKIIKKNFLNGIGYDVFKSYDTQGDKHVLGFKPHSSIIGMVVENGIFALCIFSIIMTILIKYSLNNKNYFYLTAIIFLILESINMDVHYFKIIWIFMPLMLMNKQSIN
tara:strand:- start:9397 stop:10620 length:1224 start_codon:yes stop_codon:yes gene_type:complete